MQRIPHMAVAALMLAGTLATAQTTSSRNALVIGVSRYAPATQAATLAHENALAADQSSEASRHLGQLAGQLNRLLGQFRV